MVLENSKALVGHYTSLSVACEFILKDRQIRFNPMRHMNDPRENKEWHLNVGGRGDHPHYQERVAASNAFKRARLDFSKVFCGTLDEDHDMPLNTTSIMKQCFGRPRMWAQYGDNHRGVCLVFHRDELKREVCLTVGTGDQVYSDHVVYDDYLKSVSAQAKDLEFDRIKEIGEESAIKEHVTTYQRALFFRKDSDWITESEYRLVIHRWVDGHEYVQLGDSLKAIVLGVDCSEVYIPTISKLAKNIPVVHLKWEDTFEDFWIPGL